MRHFATQQLDLYDIWSGKENNFISVWKYLSECQIPASIEPYLRTIWNTYIYEQ